MITLFTTCKPFTDRDDDAARQRYALWSWTQLQPPPPVRIMVIGDDEGVAEVAASLGIIHVAAVRTHDTGAPYLADLFELAYRYSRKGLFCYANADIVFTQDLMRAVKALQRPAPGHWLAVGHRTNWRAKPLEYPQLEDGWQRTLRARAETEGERSQWDCIDYFIHPYGMFHDIPPDLVLGCSAWDNYLVGLARSKHYPVIDLTGSVLAVHLAHGEKRLHEDAAQVQRNRDLTEGTRSTIGDATHKMNADGTITKR